MYTPSEDPRSRSSLGKALVPWVMSCLATAGCDVEDELDDAAAHDVLDPSLSAGEDELSDQPSAMALVGASDALIAQVWMAQTHVQRTHLGNGPTELDFAAAAINDNLGGPEQPLQKLIADRDALLKVDVTSASGGVPGEVTVVIELPGGASWESELVGPAGSLPTSMPAAPGQVQHDLDDSYKVIVPGEFIQPGMLMAVSLLTTGGAHLMLWDPAGPNAIAVGAPTRLPMTMFDFHYFGGGTQDFPAGFLEEAEAKWPVAALEIQRVDVSFPQISQPARAPKPAVVLDSLTHHETLFGGEKYDGETDETMAWLRALQLAGGQEYVSMYYGNILGLYLVRTGGEGNTSFRACGRGGHAGFFMHEAGHALNLWHWQSSPYYPYKGAQFGIAAPNTVAHVGPNWPYIPPHVAVSGSEFGEFIAPTVVSNGTSVYRRVPTQGGGFNDVVPGYVVNTYSDYDVRRGQLWLEQKTRVFNASLGQWTTWDEATADYSNVVASNGVSLPLVDDVAVYSIMAATNMQTVSANLVYEPIGPYQSGLIRLFDPSVPADRTDAASSYCEATGCDFSLRVTQAGQLPKVYMLRDGQGGEGTGSDPQHGHSAINLPAADGAIVLVELLHTPDAQVNGLPLAPQVLATWTP